MIIRKALKKDKKQLAELRNLMMESVSGEKLSDKEKIIS